MEIQKQILMFFSNHHSRFLDALMQGITFLGEEYAVLAVLLFLYLCMDKKRGIAGCMTLLSASSVTLLLKSLVRFPRPWVLMPELDSLRIDTAAGYSFPSGHTTTASSSYTAVAMTGKKKWLSRILAVVILLVGLSRMYLCVHWPMDVACGLLIGIPMALFLTPVFMKLYDNRDRYCTLMLIAGLAATVASSAMAILLCFGKIDYDAFSGFSKTLATLGGGALATCLEVRTTDFHIEEGNWTKKIMRYLICLAGAMVILPLSKPVLQSIGLYNPFTAAARYFLVCFWMCGAWPMLAVKLGLMEGKKSN